MEKVGQRAALDRQGAVHIGFAKGERRIHGKAKWEHSIVQSHGHAGFGPVVAKIARATALVDHREVPDTAHLVQHAPDRGKRTCRGFGERSNAGHEILLSCA